MAGRRALALSAAAFGLAVGVAAVAARKPPVEGPTGDAGEADAGAGEAPPGPVSPFARLAVSAEEIGVLTGRAPSDVQALTAPGAAARLLGPRHCGEACEAVRAFLREPGALELEVMRTEDWVLPPEDTLDVVAAGVPHPERRGLHKLATTLAVRVRGQTTRAQLAARAAQGLAAALAEALEGYVVDDGVRRIFTRAEALERCIVEPLGAPVVRPVLLAIHTYRQDDGTARLVTLGLARFGVPDLEIRGADPALVPWLAQVTNVAARKLAAFEPSAPLVVAREDVTGTPVDVGVGAPHDAGVGDDAGNARVTLALEETEREEGDPDNDLVLLTPAGGATPAGYTAVVRALFGDVGGRLELDEAIVAETARRTRAKLPALLARRSEATRLFVRGALPVDGGDPEQVWLRVRSCTERACLGVLASHPVAEAALSSGDEATLERAALSDWVLVLPDGGTEGDETARRLADLDGGSSTR